MRYYLDSEFIDDGETIDLISIGIVAEDGREYYAQSTQADFGHASPWVQEQVIAHLVRDGEGIWKSRATIRDDIDAFMDSEQYGKPELWGWCSGYDWVALCQLFGTMMDVPSAFPHYIRDVQFILDDLGLSDEDLPEQVEQAHHALSDARYIKMLWESVPQITTV